MSYPNRICCHIAQIPNGLQKQKKKIYFIILTGLSHANNMQIKDPRFQWRREGLNYEPFELKKYLARTIQFYDLTRIEICQLSLPSLQTKIL